MLQYAEAILGPDAALRTILSRVFGGRQQHLKATKSYRLQAYRHVPYQVNWFLANKPGEGS